jgi:BirA family biotin operon repressor/biotin-[acetyl-CoA-carboxylase] ligase
MEESKFKDEFQLIEQIKKTDSTNLLALREFARFADGTLLIATEQTAGVGRRGRSWLSPPGVNLYATYILKKTQFAVGDAMLIGGLATLDALRNSAPSMKLWLKWPNDICCGEPPKPAKHFKEQIEYQRTSQKCEPNEIQQQKSIDVTQTAFTPEVDASETAGTISDSQGFRKIAGLLSQTHSQSTTNDVDGIVLGIGVNLNMTHHQLSLIGRPAASVLSETGNTVDPAEFAEFLLRRLIFYRNMAETNSKSLFNQWVEANALIGGDIEIALENGELFAGEVVGINKNGAIIVKSTDDVARAFFAGDVPPRTTKTFQ